MRTDSRSPLKGLTYATLTAEDRRQSRANWSMVDIVWTGIVPALILAAYLYFSG